MENSCHKDCNSALRFLLEKYSFQAGGKIEKNEKEQIIPAKLLLDGDEFALLPWREERRFTELKNIVDQETLQGVSTLRFCRIASASECSIEQLICREFDLCEWLGGAPIKRIFAVFNGNLAANILLKLENDIVCSVECAATLPEGAETVDRHEIIARRGVASDRAVDTQIPQNSIYMFTDKTEKHFTDVDAELFGLSNEDIYLTRAAFKVVSCAETGIEWNLRKQRLIELVEAAKTSGKSGEAFAMEGK
jgi:hypothetical protein